MEVVMDRNQFDHVARLAAEARSRRGALRLLLGGALGAGGLAAVAAETAAKRKKHHHKKPKNQCAGPTGICNADPTPCGHSATGETCGCELAVEGNTFCADGANPCPFVVECTST